MSDLVGNPEDQFFNNEAHLSHVMRKSAVCICENKGADQLHGNWAADRLLTFRYIDSSIVYLYFLNSKFQVSSHLLWLYRLNYVNLVRNLETV